MSSSSGVSECVDVGVRLPGGIVADPPGGPGGPGGMSSSSMGMLESDAGGGGGKAAGGEEPSLGINMLTSGS